MEKITREELRIIMKKSIYKIERFKIKPTKNDEMVMKEYVDDNGQQKQIMCSKYPTLYCEELEK